MSTIVLILQMRRLGCLVDKWLAHASRDTEPRGDSISPLDPSPFPSPPGVWSLRRSLGVKIWLLAHSPSPPPLPEASSSLFRQQEATRKRARKWVSRWGNEKPAPANLGIHPTCLMELTPGHPGQGSRSPRAKGGAHTRKLEFPKRGMWAKVW